ncbi:hypothetical protein LTR78_008468 [Recurvomyces mirabilis]|uniref:SWIRM domain-containing protein n=1 Tax=Recurvomyces mirabilis TaxID=574656 RepID=A0AAE0TQ51_9PEZI|nr:hypothetical protein LTR78_008468 [Recurvomyces mirabilis]KAK5155456.1 hypothetical protein LTS14_005717 [Recurvomyces mirabilis]
MSDTSALHDSSSHDMASSKETSGRATIGAGQLHTPQEHLHHSFSHDKPFDPSTLLPNTLSPPASPNFVLAPQPSVDEPLFPDTERDEADQPLFDSQQSESARPSTSEATLRRHSTSEPSKTVRVPGTQIVLENKPLAAYNYFQGCMAQVERIRDATRKMPGLEGTRSKNILTRDPETRRALSRLDTFDKTLHRVDRPSRVTKTTITRRSIPDRHQSSEPALPRVTTASPGRPDTPEHASKTRPASSRRSRTPKSQSQTDFLDNAFPDKKHKRSAPSKHTPSKEDDFKWRDLPDYAPSTTDAQLKSLTAHWSSGGPLDIDDQIDVEELHGREYDVCRTLRLKPVQYLATKRRFFVAKVQFLSEGKTFTKTAAQNVTNIDVNKSSRLWEAFNNVVSTSRGLKE